MGVIQNIEDISIKSFSKIEDRLNSFNNCVVKFQQDTKTFCEAGFIYTGRFHINIFILLVHAKFPLFSFIGTDANDELRCFNCRISCLDWEVDDDPWYEHARFRPNCSYLLLSKGIHYINEVQEADEKKVKTKDLLKYLQNIINIFFMFYRNH